MANINPPIPTSIKYKEEMPRTALRYAIEKLSPELKKEAMRKNVKSHYYL